MSGTTIEHEAGVEAPPSGRSRRSGWPTIAAWGVFAVCAAYVLGGTVTHDFRDVPLAGDTAAHLMQALSLAYDSHTLNFDSQDLRRWSDLGWSNGPTGMFAQRYDGNRWAGAKPYGYSLFLAPFIAVLGPVRGVAVAQTVVLALLMAISVGLLRTRYRGPVVPLTVGAFFLAAYPYMYAYWIITDLFLGLVVLAGFACAVRFSQTGRPLWGLAGFAVMGFAVTERAAFVVLFAPLALVMLWKAPRGWLRFAMPAVGLLVLAVAVLPYLRYSDWTSVTAYGGEGRIYVSTGAPFGGATEGYSPTVLDNGRLWDQFTGPLDDKLLAVAYTVAGRHTGTLVYLPLALILIGAGIWRFPRADWWGRAAVLGALGYIAFYAVVFPTNYFGGGQSLGNRYFLHMAPALIAMAVLVRVNRRVLLVGSLVGAVAGLVLLWPQHKDPERAHFHIERTSVLQRQLPFESNQDTAAYFRCVKRDVGKVTVCQ